jgi:hypothetical protein
VKHPWQIADEHIPADVREMAKRWKMEEALIEMWRGAFIQGYRLREREAQTPPNLVFDPNSASGYRVAPFR